MKTYFAIIKDGYVFRIIDASLAFMELCYSESIFIDVTNIEPRPKIGTRYKDGRFLDRDSN